MSESEQFHYALALHLLQCLKRRNPSGQFHGGELLCPYFAGDITWKFTTGVTALDYAIEHKWVEPRGNGYRITGEAPPL